MLRRWTAADLPQIAQLERESFADAWTTEMLETEFVRGDFYGILLGENGKAVGYAMGTVLFEDAELFKIAVLSEFRGKGYGGTLLDEWIKTVKAQGAERIFLEVRANNAPAIGLYKSRGFEDTRLRKKYYPDGEDAREMKKQL